MQIKKKDALTIGILDQDLTNQWNYVRLQVLQISLSNAYIQCILGILLLLIFYPYIKTKSQLTYLQYDKLEKAYQICLSSDSERPNPELNNQLVFMTGLVNISDQLQDPESQFIFRNCIKAKRVVEMYYMNPKGQLEWGSEKSIVNKHFIIKSNIFQSKYVKCGAYNLTNKQLDYFQNYKTCSFLDQKLMHTFIQKLRLMNPLNQEPEIHFDQNYIYIRYQDKTKPCQGDLRIHYEQITCQEVTIVAQQTGLTFMPYQLDYDNQNQNYQCSELKPNSQETEIDFIHDKKVTKLEMFQIQASKIKKITSISHLFGFFICVIATYLVFSPIYLILKENFLINLLFKFLVIIIAICFQFPSSLSKLVFKLIVQNPLLIFRIFYNWMLKKRLFFYIVVFSLIVFAIFFFMIQGGCFYDQRLINGQCVDICHKNQYLQNYECKNCDQTCATCKTQNHCLTCPQNNLLFNGSCLQNCPSGYSPNKKDICVENSPILLILAIFISLAGIGLIAFQYLSKK